MPRHLAKCSNSLVMGFLLMTLLLATSGSLLAEDPKPAKPNTADAKNASSKPAHSKPSPSKPGASKSAPSKRQFSAPVKVAQIELRSLSPSAFAPGNVISLHDLSLPTEEEGRIEFIVEHGQQLQQGELVAQIDVTQVELQLREFQAQVKQEQALIRFLKAEVGRLSRLSKTNLAARSQLDEAESNLDAALAAKELATAKVAQAEDRIARSKILAPVAGMVSERHKKAGEWVSQGDDVVRLVDTTQLEVEAFVPLTSLPYLTVGQPLLIQWQQHQDQQKQSQVIVKSVTQVADERSRLVEVRLALSEPIPVYQPVKLLVPTGAASRVTAVPRDALVLRRQGAAIFIINEQLIAQKVAVETGIAEGAWIQVSGDIKVGQQVVVRGNERLRAGQSVMLLDEQSNPIKPKQVSGAAQ